MQAYASLWSADLLDIGRALEEVGSHVDGFHIDVMDGHFVRALGFGLDFVRSVCLRTHVPVEAHLMVAEPDVWLEPFARAGCQSIIVHPEASPDAGSTLKAIERLGVQPALALAIHRPVPLIRPYIELVDRLVLMGTAIGVKGVDLEPDTCDRVREAVQLRDSSVRRPKVIVDGGIRENTVLQLAQAGCDGVIPGSIVFGTPDPVQRLRWIGTLNASQPSLGT